MPPTITHQVSNEQLQELVAQVEAAAGQDLPFLTLLIELMAKLIGGLSGAVFVLRDDQQRLVTVYPVASDRRVQVDSDRVAILRDCVQRCQKAGKISVFRVGMGNDVYHAVCTPLICDGRIDGVAVVMTAPQDRSELTPFLAHVQWAGRLYRAHVATRRLKRHQREAADTRRALNVLAASHVSGRFQACSMSVCNQVALELNAHRVSLGWVHGQSVRLVALSHTENVDRRQELSQKIEAAMEECFDQTQTVIAPIDHLNSDHWLQKSVRRCHEDLIGAQDVVCSVPLRYGDDIWGVLMVERALPLTFDEASASHMQAMADLIAPRLVDRFADDRPMVVKVWASMRMVAGRLVGPHQVGLKLTTLAVLGLIIYASFARWSYRVEAPFTFEARQKRVYAAPFASHIDRVYVRKGDQVKAGDHLVKLDDSHLRLSRDAAEGRCTVATIDYTGALGGPPALAKRHRAEMQALKAEVKLLDQRIADSLLQAVEDGIVVLGEWHERVGVPVELGTVLFEIAPLASPRPGGRLRAQIRVDEADIDLVAIGGGGQLAAKGAPTEAVQFRVSRVVPIGIAQEGRNVFAVFADLQGDEPWMKSGMEGVAKIDAGERRIIWIFTHKFVDFLRLALWW